MSRPSYSHGTSDLPLLGETIGENLGASRRPLPRPRGARRRAQRPPVDLRGSSTRRSSALARGLLAAGHRQGRPGRHLVAELRRVGAAAVRHRQDRRDPGQRQPGLPHPRAGLRAPAVGRAAAGQRGRVQDERLPGDGRGGPRRPARAGAGDLPRHGRVGGAGGRRAPRWTPSALAERMADAVARRPDQHPVHLGHHRLPQGRDAVAPQHPEQRLLHRRAAAATPRSTGCACRCPSTTASAW